MSQAFYVVNLDRSPGRWQSFQANNPHLHAAQRYSAVDGRLLSRETLVKENMIAPENNYSPGALGCAATHIALWREAVRTGEPLTVIEDDAITHTYLEAAVASAMKIQGWDIIHWGWNVDWPALVQLAPGLPVAVIYSLDRAPSFDHSLFLKSTFHSNLVRVYSAAGTLCYSVSPKGAQRLLDTCLPIGNQPAPYFSDPSKIWMNYGIDVELSRHYHMLDSYCAMPPLVYSLNDWDTSDIRPNDAEIFASTPT